MQGRVSMRSVSLAEAIEPHGQKFLSAYKGLPVAPLAVDGRLPVPFIQFRFHTHPLERSMQAACAPLPSFLKW